MKRQLEFCDVFDHGPAEIIPRLPCRVFRAARMGVGTSKYYPVVFEGDHALIPEPEIRQILDRFDIDPEAFMRGCNGESSNGHAGG